MKQIPGGIYPVMITPFTSDNRIDWPAVDAIVEFYAKADCNGIFSVCQSSEMFFLSEEERVELAARVVKASAGRMCVVASGHISPSIEDQIRELKRISETGVDAIVMISCLLAAQEESDDVLIANMNRILEAIPDKTFGMYECPYPYKRLLSEKVLDAMLASGRFAFIKDTCCDAALIEKRLKQLNGKISLFNANCATFYETMLTGAAGFSGIMANYHPDLLVWLYEHYRDEPEKARVLSAELSVLSGVERNMHPVSAKYHMQLEGIPMTLKTRVIDDQNLQHRPQQPERCSPPDAQERQQPHHEKGRSGPDGLRQ